MPIFIKVLCNTLLVHLEQNGKDITSHKSFFSSGLKDKCIPLKQKRARCVLWPTEELLMKW